MHSRSGCHLIWVGRLLWPIICPRGSIIHCVCAWAGYYRANQRLSMSCPLESCIYNVYSWSVLLKFTLSRQYTIILLGGGSDACRPHLIRSPTPCNTLQHLALHAWLVCGGGSTAYSCMREGINDMPLGSCSLSPGSTIATGRLTQLNISIEPGGVVHQTQRS